MGVKPSSRANEAPGPDRAVTLVAIMKNELEYVLEWLAYHQCRGFSRFIIGDNDSVDGTSELLEALDACGLIERIFVPTHPRKKGIQGAFYNQVARALRTSATDPIVGFIDADEFLMSPDDANLARRVHEIFEDSSVSALGLNWRVYGSSGFTRTSVGPILQRFSGHAPKAFEFNRHIKTFVRLSRLEHMNTHDAEIEGGRYVNDCGEDLSRRAQNEKTDEVSWQRLFINHYVLKSRMEFKRKKSRKGSATRGADTVKGAPYFKHHDRYEHVEIVPSTLLEQLHDAQGLLQRALERNSLYYRPCTGAVTIDADNGMLRGWLATPGAPTDDVRVVIKRGSSQLLQRAPQDGAIAPAQGTTPWQRFRFHIGPDDLAGLDDGTLEVRPYGSCVRLPVDTPGR